jgi:hypothetical protein
LFVALEHILPERLDLVNMTSFAVHRDTGQQEPFCEFTFQADFLIERAHCLIAFVVAQPKRVWQALTLG